MNVAAGSATETPSIRPMPGPFGAWVDDVDLQRPVDDDTIRLLTDALWSHRILVLPNQYLSDTQYVDFGGCWGEPIEFFVPSARLADHPEIIRIRNSPAVPPESRDGAMHWHSDSSYEAVPAMVTMLYGVEIPTSGNDTLFLDTVAAYAALDSDLKKRIADLAVIHDPSGGKVTFDGEVRGRGRHDDLPVVTHPLVARHPVVGRKSLYGFSGTAAGIVGMPEGEALELLIQLKRFALQDRFRQRARCDVGSVLIWDNWSVLHSATPTCYSNADGERRLIHRISTRGVPAVCTATAAAGAR
ncbi:TauD/TfdA family dioxygenase [Frankia sp. Cas3]|uniref:TauD/TfdA dioxygenase family protein n=1 Tax=Frankia sp. Cas3 TaxID=3073926 RepID=UPI002AD4A89F|nr:TauD/TfdA family dioxygenase [Frankia sp. Cas3]